MSYQTPWTQTLAPGTYTVTLTELNVTDNEGHQWVFTGWQDTGAATNPRTVTLTEGQDVVLMAVYQEQSGPTTQTPYTATLPIGQHTITMPQSVTQGGVIYTFIRWEDGSTNPVRTIDLTADTIVTATYAEATPPPTNYTLTLDSNIIGAQITIDGQTYTAPDTITLAAGAHTIQAITPLTIAGQTYTFTNWQDGTTNPTTTFTLAANSSVTATYALSTTPTVSKNTLIGLGILGTLTLGAIVAAS